MRKFYERHPHRYFETKPEIGLVCAVAYCEDWNEYRARILEIDAKTDNAWVEFIDYGNVECVSLRGLRRITPDFLEDPQLVIFYFLGLFTLIFFVIWFAIIYPTAEH